MNPVIPPPVRAEEADEILTLEELAIRLRVSVWTVRRLIKRRVLSPLRTGRVLRFHWPTVKHRLGVVPIRLEKFEQFLLAHPDRHSLNDFAVWESNVHYSRLRSLN